MIIKIRIKTPKNGATGIEKKIRGWLLPRKVTPKVEVNGEGSEIIWTVDTDIRRATKIYKNVGRFDALMSGIMGSKMVRKRVLKEQGQKGLDELNDMLINHTSCEIIREDTPLI